VSMVSKMPELIPRKRRTRAREQDSRRHTVRNTPRASVHTGYGFDESWTPSTPQNTVADNPTKPASNSSGSLTHLTFIYRRQWRLKLLLLSPVWAETHANPRVTDIRNASTNPTAATDAVSAFAGLKW
jgi:hypothetical protein